MNEFQFYSLVSAITLALAGAAWALIALTRFLARVSPWALWYLAEIVLLIGIGLLLSRFWL